MMNKDWPSYLDLPRKAGRSDGMNDNRIAEIQQQCEKRNTTKPIIFKNNLATVDVVRALMEEITSCNEDVTYLLAQLAERDKEIEQLREAIASVHKSLDFADSQRQSCKNYTELAINNGLALGRIAVTLKHDFKEPLPAAPEEGAEK